MLVYKLIEFVGFDWISYPIALCAGQYLLKHVGSAEIKHALSRTSSSTSSNHSWHILKNPFQKSDVSAVCAGGIPFCEPGIIESIFLAEIWALIVDCKCFVHRANCLVS